MKVGTRSLLFGMHQFLLHPVIVLIGWCKLYGFPKDPRILVAILVHDWGYWGKPNMDGAEGKTHPKFGGQLMHQLFDRPAMVWKRGNENWTGKHWRDFTAFHSRSYAKLMGSKESPLCAADKLALLIMPVWLTLFLYTLSGECNEYMGHDKRDYGFVGTRREWLNKARARLQKWVETNKQGEVRV